MNLAQSLSVAAGAMVLALSVNDGAGGEMLAHRTRVAIDRAHHQIVTLSKHAQMPCATFGGAYSTESDERVVTSNNYS